MTRSIAQFAQVTARQYALVTRQQLLDLEVSRHQIATMLRNGSFELVRPNVYLLAGAPRSYEQGLLAAVLSAGENAAASHVCAGRVWTCRYTDDATYELTVPRPRMPKLEGVRVHSSSVLGEDDIT